jgi:alpha-beta hydrolase superfamily lysophospholipase
MKFLAIPKIHQFIKSLLLFTSLILPCISYAQTSKPWDGYWKGDLSVGGMQLTLIFHVNPPPPSQVGDAIIYRSTLDVPIQRLKNFKIDETEIKGEEITWRLSLPATFQGKRNAEGFLIGNWTQGGKSFPLTLRYSETLNSVKPQTPKPPFSYTSKWVDFSHPSGKLKFGGTLTYPDTNSIKNEATAQSIYHLARKTPNPADPTFKLPAVLLLSGSGPQDRDETLGDHKPFAIWADFLTKLGFVVLRVDDRGVGSSTGDIKFLETTTTASYVSDAQAAIRFLYTQPMVDTMRIFVLGHSEGANVAVKLANAQTDISGVISLAGMTSSGVETSIFQNQINWKALKLDSGLISGLSDLHREMIQLAFQTTSMGSIDDQNDSKESVTSTSEYESQLKAYIANNKSDKNLQRAYKYQISQSKETAKAVGAKSTLSFLAQPYIGLATNPWTSYFLQSEPEKEFTELKNCDILMIQGSMDQQIDASGTAKLVYKMNQTGVGVTYREFTGLNHLLQHCNTCDVSEYFNLDETIAMEVMSFVGYWLTNRNQLR